MKRIITEKKLQAFDKYLWESEKSKNTVEKYMRDVRKFSAYAQEGEISRDTVLLYKESLSRKHTATGANSIIAALNCFFRFCGWNELCVKQLKVQKKAFCSKEKELTRDEYNRLVRAAERINDERTALLIQTICGTGIRVSELSFITVEAARNGVATVSCKGKTRTVFVISALQKKLLRYAKKRRIESGPIFITKSGKSMDRCSVWRKMKAFCESAGVSREKVFPHNLRHLFARTFYNMEKDIAKLADILGHSSINTTRIYIVTTCDEHRRRMERMHLII